MMVTVIFFSRMNGLTTGIKFQWLHDLFMGFNAGDAVSSISPTTKNTDCLKYTFEKTIDQKCSQPTNKKTKTL